MKRRIFENFRISKINEVESSRVFLDRLILSDVCATFFGMLGVIIACVEVRISEKFQGPKVAGDNLIPKNRLYYYQVVRRFTDTSGELIETQVLQSESVILRFLRSLSTLATIVTSLSSLYSYSTYKDYLIYKNEVSKECKTKLGNSQRL